MGSSTFPDGLEQNGNDSTANLISLSHVYWNKGQFALKPISVSADSKTLTVQFFWQAKRSVVMPKINLATIPLSTRDLDRYRNNALYDGRQINCPKIESGQLFEITTDNPEVRPLPSIALLEMQWFLQRVMGMAGAVDVEEGYDYAFDSEVSNQSLPDNTGLLPLLETSEHQPEDKTKYVRDYIFMIS
jgi:hypothetical protein